MTDYLRSLIQKYQLHRVLLSDTLSYSLCDYERLRQQVWDIDWDTIANNDDTTNNCGVMVVVLDASAVDRGFESRSGQTKNYKIGICCFSATHAALRRESKYWLARYQDNVSEWGDMYTHRLLFQ